MAAIDIQDDAQAQCFEARIDGQVAGMAQYRVQGDALVFTHTEVQPQFEGQGVGSQLARHALDEVRRRGLKAVPQCRFIATYIERHPEYASLVAQQG